MTGSTRDGDSTPPRARTGFCFRSWRSRRSGSWGRDVELCADVRAIGIDLAGVELVPNCDSWLVLEVNGAVDMRPHYALDTDVFVAALRSLQRGALQPA